MLIKKLLFFVTGTLLLSQGARAQYILLDADTMRVGELNGQSVKQMIGHVRFVQGSMNGTANRAIHYLNQDRVELIGDVVVHQDTLSLEAPLVTFNTLTQVGHAEGGVHLADRDALLTAENGDYDVGNQTAYFHKSVIITQGRTTIRSNDLTYYRATQTSVAKGNVTAVSDSGTLKSDQLTYSRALGEMTAVGHVSLKNDSTTLTSNWLYNSQPLGIMYARGKVAVHDIGSNSTLFGDTLARFAKTNYTIVPINPLLHLIDTSKVEDSVTHQFVKRLDTTFIKSRVMEAYQGDSSRFIATDSVRMLRGSFSATGGHLLYDRAKDRMYLAQGKRQRIWSDSTEVASDSMAMFLKGQQVDHVHAVGHAFATDVLAEMPGSGRIQQITGESMLLSMQNDSLRDVLVMNNAMSIYFLYDNGRPNGMNRSSGDSIRLDFKDRQVNRIAVISGTEGEYWPERFIHGRETAFRLAAYERRTELRPKIEDFWRKD